jgi:hypothetical protein
MLGLAMTLALMLGGATTALAAVPGDPFKLGRVNTINALTSLVGSVNNAMIKVDNNSTGTSATALDLQVEPGKAPMMVNSQTKVANLNADTLDGKDSASCRAPTSLAQRATPNSALVAVGLKRLRRSQTFPLASTL